MKLVGTKTGHGGAGGMLVHNLSSVKSLLKCPFLTYAKALGISFFYLSFKSAQPGEKCAVNGALSTQSLMSYQ